MSRCTRFSAWYVAVLSCVLMFAVPSYGDTGSKSARSLIDSSIDSSKLVVIAHPVRSPHTVADAGRVDGSQQLQMRLVLRRSPEQQAALDVLNLQARTPGDAMYGKTISAEEFEETFAPAQSDVSKMRAWLEEKGFEVTAVSAGELRIEFSGTAGQAEEAFGTQLHNFTEKNGRSYFAPAGSVKVPSAMSKSVQRIEGLQNHVPEPVRSFDGPVGPERPAAVFAQAESAEITGEPGREANKGWTSPMTNGTLTSMRERARQTSNFQANNQLATTTTVTVTGTPQPVVYGSGTALTVQAVVAWAGGTTPTGTVSLYDSGSALNTVINLTSCTLGTGQYTCTYTWNTPSGAQAVNPDVVSATYGGNTTYAFSTGTTTLGVTYATGTGTPALLSLANAPNTVVEGATTQQTFTFILGGTVGEGVPTGTVMLWGTGAIGKIAEISAFTTGNGCVTATRAITCTVKWNPAATLPAGSYTLQASYSGNTKIASYIVVDPTLFTVTASGTTATTTTVTVNPNVVYSAGEGTTFTTKTTWTGSGQPTGALNLTSTGANGGGFLGGAVYPAVGSTTSSGTRTYDFGQYTYTYNCSEAANAITCTIVDSDVYDLFPIPFEAYTVTAAYGGDTVFKGSSGTTTLTVDFFGGFFPTITNVSAAPSTAQYGTGTSITYTVTIFDEDDIGAQPGGTVTLQGVPVTGGVINYTVNAANCPYSTQYATATCTITSAVPTAVSSGSYSVQALYSGDDFYNASSGAATVTITGNIPTSTTATAVPTSVNTATPSTTVTSITTWTGSGGTPTGTVAMTCGAGSAGICQNLPAPKNVSACTISTANKTITCSLTYALDTQDSDYGIYHLVMTYSGDINYAGSSSVVAIGDGGTTVSTTTLTAGASPTANYGAGPVESFTVTVKGAADDIKPSGSITVNNGTLGLLATVNLSATCTSTGTGGATVFTCPATGTYTVPASTLGGTYTLTFQYSGSNTYAASSTTTVLTVNPDATTTAIVANPTNVSTTGSTQVTATVANTPVPAVTPTGTVSFASGATALGSCTLSGGTCSVTVNGSSLAVGTDTITATYGGVSEEFLGSSKSTTVTVAPPDGLSFTSVTHNFGSVTNGTSTTGTANYGVKVTNNGVDPYANFKINLSGSAEFTEITNCPTSLAAGKFCEILFTFSPTATGTQTATWSISGTSGFAYSPSNGGTLSGTGAPATGVTLSTGGHNFGTIIVGATSPVYGTVLTNTTATAVTLTYTTVSSPFVTYADDCGASLPAGHSCNLEFQFAPTVTGITQQEFGIQVNGGATSITASGGVAVTGVTLTGTGQ